MIDSAFKARTFKPVQVFIIEWNYDRTSNIKSYEVNFKETFRNNGELEINPENPSFYDSKTIFPVTQNNINITEKMTDIAAQINALTAEARSLRESLDRMDFSVLEEKDSARKAIIKKSSLSDREKKSICSFFAAKHKLTNLKAWALMEDAKWDVFAADKLIKDANIVP